MKFIERKDAYFIEYWNKFIQENDDVSPFYSLSWIEYQIAYSGEKFIEDLSFVIIDEANETLVICPLFLEIYDGCKKMSYRGEYMEALRSPLMATRLTTKQKKELRKMAFDHIERIAKYKKIAKCTFIIDPICGDGKREGYNYLTRYGYIDASLTTMVIELNQGWQNIWKKVRKSYKSVINAGVKYYNPVVLDCDNITINEFEAYVEMHHKAAGRITRPRATFDIQYDMIKQDQAILVGTKVNGIWTAFAYFLHSKFSAYYGSGAQDPDVVVERPVGHALQWIAIRFYESKGLLLIEMDNQYFGAQLFECPSEKEIQISSYKRGFGGKLTPLFRGVKYFDKKLMKTELQDLERKLLENYFKNGAGND